MTERLQKILSSRGVTSRRSAEDMINAGRVTCNGQLAHLGMRADPEVDHILIDGKPLPSVQEHVYIALNKPRGYVTTLSDEKGRPDAAQLKRQLMRYAACEGVDALIVISSRSVSLPALVMGKPVYGIVLNQLWGVALP